MTIKAHLRSSQKCSPCLSARTSKKSSAGHPTVEALSSKTSKNSARYLPSTLSTAISPLSCVNLTCTTSRRQGFKTQAFSSSSTLTSVEAIRSASSAWYVRPILVTPTKRNYCCSKDDHWVPLLRVISNIFPIKPTPTRSACISTRPWTSCAVFLLKHNFPASSS